MDDVPMSVSNTQLTSTAIVATTLDRTSSSGAPLMPLGDEQHSLISLLLILWIVIVPSAGHYDMRRNALVGVSSAM
uniref:Uncharacterized protein n=1 Tax=Parascaris equorum TaxID=6256 RepID=A0A914RR44_PAREQ